MPVKWHQTMKLYHPWHPTGNKSGDQHAQTKTPAVKAQLEFIRRRACALETKPYCGIAPAYNHDPDWWETWMRMNVPRNNKEILV